MNKSDMESWILYSTVWRHVLVKVLKWPRRRINKYIEYMHTLAEQALEEQNPFSFFYDPPSRYLFRAIMDGTLQKKMRGKKWRRLGKRGVSRHYVFELLINAISGGDESDLANKNFDWVAARERYKRKRKWVENWIAPPARKRSNLTRQMQKPR